MSKSCTVDPLKKKLFWPIYIISRVSIVRELTLPTCWLLMFASVLVTFTLSTLMSFFRNQFFMTAVAHSGVKSSGFTGVTGADILQMINCWLELKIECWDLGWSSISAALWRGGQTVLLVLLYNPLLSGQNLIESSPLATTILPGENTRKSPFLHYNTNMSQTKIQLLMRGLNSFYFERSRWR